MRYYFIHYMNILPNGLGFGSLTVLMDGLFNQQTVREYIGEGIDAEPETITICNYKELTKEEYEAFNR